MDQLASRIDKTLDLPTQTRYHLRYTLNIQKKKVMSLQQQIGDLQIDLLICALHIPVFVLKPLDKLRGGR